MQEEEFRKLTEGLLRGERLYLSKAITLAETSSPALFPFRDRLLELAETAAGSGSFRLALTGVPGAGKSTLLNVLGLQWIAAGHKVAVLAVDPSSDVSLGSVLGDKTRMAELAREENAFIRPSPTRLHLGGVASTTFETILLCEAAGYDRILIETVGVGQSELEASQLTDACLLLLVAGTGDELQAVKRGILEAADFILVNKADGENRERALAFSRELKQVSGLWPERGHGRKAEIFSGSSNDPEWPATLQQKLEEFLQDIKSSRFLEDNRRAQKQRWFREMLRRRMAEKIYNSTAFKVLLEESEGKFREAKPFLYLLSELSGKLDISLRNSGF